VRKVIADKLFRSLGGPADHPLNYDVLEHRAAQVGPRHVRPPDVVSSGVHIAEVGASEVDIPQVGSSKVAAKKRSSTHGGALQVSAVEVAPEKGRVIERDLPQVRIDKAALLQADLGREGYGTKSQRVEIEALEPFARITGRHNSSSLYCIHRVPSQRASLLYRPGQLADSLTPGLHNRVIPKATFVAAPSYLPKG
jgi:hypothetical protein